MEEKREEGPKGFKPKSLVAMALAESHVSEKEKELRQLVQDYQKRNDELLQRESDLRKQFSTMEAVFHDREKSLVQLQNQLMERQATSEALRARLQEEHSQREAKLKLALAELQQEKERYNEESRKRLEKNSQDYVAEALSVLDRKEQQFHKFSKAWALFGAVCLALASVFFVVTTYLLARDLPADVSWQLITFSLFKGVLGIALLGALARYAFLFSNAYMREALKNADRTHAINFGKFYLQSYGAAADWAQVKEAFANWNISGANSFAANGKLNTDLTDAERAASIVEKLVKALPKLKSVDSA